MNWIPLILVENISYRLNQHTVRASVILTLVFHIYYTPFNPLLSLSPSYPLLRLPLPGTGPVEFTTGVRDYSVPSHEPQGDLGERPDWVGEEKAQIHIHRRIFSVWLPLLSLNCIHSLTLNPKPHPNLRLIMIFNINPKLTSLHKNCPHSESLKLVLRQACKCHSKDAGS